MVPRWMSRWSGGYRHRATRHPGQTGETKAFAPLLGTLDITGAVITADALHTVQANARYLFKRRAFYVFTVKENTPALFDEIDALAWDAEPIAFMTCDRAHGRDELRTIKVLPAPPGLGFPDAKQVMLIERYVADQNRQTISGRGPGRNQPHTPPSRPRSPARSGPRGGRIRVIPRRRSRRSLASTTASSTWWSPVPRT